MFNSLQMRSMPQEGEELDVLYGSESYRLDGNSVSERVEQRIPLEENNRYDKIP